MLKAMKQMSSGKVQLITIAKAQEVIHRKIEKVIKSLIWNNHQWRLMMKQLLTSRRTMISILKFFLGVMISLDNLVLVWILQMIKDIQFLDFALTTSQ